MTNIKPQSKWAILKTLLLALPFLALLGMSVPSAKADDYHRRYHRGRSYRHHGYYRHHRRYYYRHGRRYYYGGDPYYYGPRPGVSVHVGL